MCCSPTFLFLCKYIGYPVDRFNTSLWPSCISILFLAKRGKEDSNHRHADSLVRKNCSHGLLLNLVFICLLLFHLSYFPICRVTLKLNSGRRFLYLFWAIVDLTSDLTLVLYPRTLRHGAWESLKRVAGFEPVPPVWKTGMLAANTTPAN